MKTKDYLKVLRNGEGHLNPNPQKYSETSPDYFGFLKIENETFKISAWICNNKLTLKFNPCDDNGKIIFLKSSTKW